MFLLNLMNILKIQKIDLNLNLIGIRMYFKFWLNFNKGSTVVPLSQKSYCKENINFLRSFKLIGRNN